MKPETKFWLRVGWNALFKRYHGRESPYVICSIAMIVVFMLFALLPHYILNEFFSISLSFVTSVFLVIMGFLFGLFAGIYLAYLFYINGVQ